MKNLTGLDVSKNTALTDLYCENNQLTAEGLNALFGTLHDNAGDKRIYFAGNPGAGDCNRQRLDGVCELSNSRQARKPPHPRRLLHKSLRGYFFVINLMRLP